MPRSTAWLYQRIYLKWSVVLLFNEKQPSMLQVEGLHKEGILIFFSLFKIQSFIYKYREKTATESILLAIILHNASYL